MGDTLAIGDSRITLRQTYTLPDAADLPADMQYLLVDIDVSAGSETLDTTSLRLEFVDLGGQVYTPNPSALAYAEYDGLPPLNSGIVIALSLCGLPCAAHDCGWALGCDGSRGEEYFL